MSNPLQDLRNLGQSFWLDYIDRVARHRRPEATCRGGRAARVTSNPSIFEKAVAGSTLYDQALSTYMAANPGISAKDLFEHVGIRDIQDAADVLRPVYDESAAPMGSFRLRSRLIWHTTRRGRSPRGSDFGAR